MTEYFPPKKIHYDSSGAVHYQEPDGRFRSAEYIRKDQFNTVLETLRFYAAGHTDGGLRARVLYDKHGG